MELAELASLRGKHAEAVGFADRSKAAALEFKKLRQTQTSQHQHEGMSPEMSGMMFKRDEAITDHLIYERTAKILEAAGEDLRALELVSSGIKKRRVGNLSQLRHFAESGFHPDESLRLQGDLQVAQGDIDKAIESYKLALDAVSKSYPESHPARLDVLESLAIAKAISGDKARASELASQVFDGRMQSLEDVLTFADEPMRLAYRSSIDPWSVFATLNLPDPLCVSILRTKGVVLDSILEDRKAERNATDPKLQRTLLTLQNRRRRLMESLLGGASQTGRDTNALRSEIQQLETQLKSGTRNGSRAALSVNVADVAAAIPDNAVLIEFFRYRDFESPGRGTDRYGAVLLDGSATPVFQPLGPAKEIESAIESYGKLVRKVVDDAEMVGVLNDIRRLVWEPLTQRLPQPGSQLVLSPDSALNFFSFATLLEPDGTFLAEKYPVAYVTSGRDLVRGVKPSTNNSLTILANPDFQKSGAVSRLPPAAQRSGKLRGMLGQVDLCPLPGAELEAELIHKLVTEQWKWPAEVLTGVRASEAATTNIAGPKILHFATHGFFLPKSGRIDPFASSRHYWDASVEQKDVRGALTLTSNVTLENPMHRSGIALAGAQTTLTGWSTGRVSDTANDGILTAEEIAMLDLNGTWLAVLSACETGLGEARSGEGVLGLRRGLLQAGAANLLFTLWPVSDRETVLFVRDFYTELDGGRNEPSTAAHKIQTKYLRKFREQLRVAAAVRLAGPFILSFQSDPPTEKNSNGLQNTPTLIVRKSHL